MNTFGWSTRSPSPCASPRRSTGRALPEMDWVDFFSSREGLHLCNEEAVTRQVPRREGWYNLSTHYPWIGNRTRHLDGAHVEYFRGIAQSHCR